MTKDEAEYLGQPEGEEARLQQELATVKAQLEERDETILMLREQILGLQGVHNAHQRRLEAQRDRLAAALREARYLATNNRGAVNPSAIKAICDDALTTLEADK